MTYDEYLTRALELPGARADKPFENDFETTVLRHGEGGKWFGILMHVAPGRIGRTGDDYTAAKYLAPKTVAPGRIGRTGDERIWIVNLKCTPEEGFALREEFPAICPAYHMNKLHWITLPLDADLPEAIISGITERSFDLTAKKVRHR